MILEDTLQSIIVAVTDERSIIAAADLRAIIAQDTELVAKGKGFVGICPFHAEKTPSFHVSAKRGMYHCFACGRSGNAADYLVSRWGFSYADAQDYLTIAEAEIGAIRRQAIKNAMVWGRGWKRTKRRRLR